MSLEQLRADFAQAIAELGDEQAMLSRATTLADAIDTLDEFKSNAGRVSEFSDEALKLDVIEHRISVDGAQDVLARLEAVEGALVGSGERDVDTAAVSELRAALTQFVSDARRAVSIKWTEFCRSHGPPQVPEGFLRIFEEIHPEEIGQIRQHLMTASMYTDVDVPPAKGIRAYVAAAREIPGLLAGLVGNDPEVRSFVQALADGGASLDLLTASVSEWMETNETEDGRPVSSLFRVTLQSYRE